MTALDVEVGRDYIVLARSRSGVSEGLKVGKVVGFAGNDRAREVLMVLRMGMSAPVASSNRFDHTRYRYAKAPRRVAPNDIRREATSREVQLARALDVV